jgi:hypothetical protein
MGVERECKLHVRGKTISGKAQLESDHLLFRGTERLKIMLRDLSRVRAENGVLIVHFAAGRAAFELGPAAAKWAQKIRKPPSRQEKLGVKAGLQVSLEGIFENSFVREVRARKAQVIAGKTKRDLIFLAVEHEDELARIRKSVTKLKPDGGVWVVYPKGVKTVREIHVLDAGRAAGLRDSKVASFSPTHTALKFVIPLHARPAG